MFGSDHIKYQTEMSSLDVTMQPLSLTIGKTLNIKRHTTH